MLKNDLKLIQNILPMDNFNTKVYIFQYVSVSFSGLH